MKIQSLKLGPQLCATAMNIVANYYEENEEDLDEEDESELSETNPGTLSLQLIDNMSSTLPLRKLIPLFFIPRRVCQIWQPCKGSCRFHVFGLCPRRCS